MIPAENGQCYPFKIYPTPYGENLCPRFLFVLGNISLESWASLERVYTIFLRSIEASSLGLTSNHPSSYEGCRRKGSQEKLCIERGSLPFEIIVLSLIFDRLQDASHIINTEERMVSLLNDMLNFFFFIQLYRFLKICYFFFDVKSQR